MKCPKCGSKIIREEYNKYQCAICLYEWEDKAEPTIAEKLYWIAEKGYLGYIDTTPEGYEISCWIIREHHKGGTREFCHCYKTLDEAVNEAYKWAKEARDESNI